METISIVAPVSGELVELTQLDDKVFSEYLMGVGIAIQSMENMICSPIDGSVSYVADTGHAIVISNSNFDIMIHIGIDTCKLHGEPFKILVNENMEVKKGQELIMVDFKQIQKHGLDDRVILILMENKNMDLIDNLPKSVNRGDLIIKV